MNVNGGLRNNFSENNSHARSKSLVEIAMKAKPTSTVHILQQRVSHTCTSVPPELAAAKPAPIVNTPITKAVIKITMG